MKCYKTWYIYIIIGGFNIDDLSIKLPIAKVYSSPMFHLIQYVVCNLHGD